MKTQNIFASHHWHSAVLADDQLDIKPQLRSNTAFRLSMETRLGVKIAEMAGEPIIQYNDILPRTDADLEDLYKNLIQQSKQENIDLLYFHNVRVDSTLYQLLANQAKAINTKSAPFIDLSPLNNLDDYLKTLSAKTRKSKRRTLKKLEQAYHVEFESLVDDKINTALFDQVIKLKADQLKRLGLTSRMFNSFTQIANLREIISKPNKDFQCIFSLLKCDGELAAAEIGYVQNQIYYSFLGAMDDRFANYSPGSCQLLKTIEWAIDKDLETFDLLAPEDPYKFSWTAQNAAKVHDIVLPLSTKGKLVGYLYLKHLRPQLKRIYLYLKQVSK